MPDEDEPGLLAEINAVRGFIGYCVVFALAVAYLVLGHTAGRIVGIVVLVPWLALGVNSIRKFRRVLKD